MITKSPRFQGGGGGGWGAVPRLTRRNKPLHFQKEGGIYRTPSPRRAWFIKHNEQWTVVIFVGKGKSEKVNVSQCRMLFIQGQRQGWQEAVAPYDFPIKISLPHYANFGTRFFCFCFRFEKIGIPQRYIFFFFFPGLAQHRYISPPLATDTLAPPLSSFLSKWMTRDMHTV